MFSKSSTCVCEWLDRGMGLLICEPHRGPLPSWLVACLRTCSGSGYLGSTLPQKVHMLSELKSLVFSLISSFVFNAPCLPWLIYTLDPVFGWIDKSADCESPPITRGSG